MILIAFRHGLRCSELVELRWDQVDFHNAVLHVCRAKQGTPSVHPLTGLEMRALRRLQRENEAGSFVFVSERGAIHDSRVCQDDGARRGDGQPQAESPSTHAATRLRLRPSQRGTRHPRFASISPAQQHPAYGAIGGDIDYAMLVKLYGESPDAEKRYSPAVCIGARKAVVEGDPDPQSHQHVLCRAAKSERADAYSALYEADQCVLKEG